MNQEEYFGLDKKRYETRAINEEVPLTIRFLLWQLVDEVEEKDYLQIFRLKVVHQNGKRVQKIIHSQEIPEMSREYTLPMEGEGVNDKIYCIDDGTVCTMLYAREY